MSISTYSELVTAVGNWLKRSDQSSMAGDYISLGEARINGALRVRAMESALSGTISSGVVAAPSNYVELKTAYLLSTPYQILDRRNAEWIYRMYPNRDSTGRPRFIARERGNFIFGPYPDSSYTLNGTYYARLSALSSATNDLFAAYPGLYLSAALAEASKVLKDDKRLSVWEATFQDLVKEVQYEDSRENYSGSRLAVSAA